MYFIWTLNLQGKPGNAISELCEPRPAMPEKSWLSHYLWSRPSLCWPLDIPQQNHLATVDGTAVSVCEFSLSFLNILPFSFRKDKVGKKYYQRESEGEKVTWLTEKPSNENSRGNSL
jgi:hypothetical protein